MNPFRRQGNLFEDHILSVNSITPNQQLKLSRDLLQDWQKKVHSHQTKFFKGEGCTNQQGSLFAETHKSSIDELEPLSLVPLPLNFWRWPQSPHHGPAVYLVIDHQEDMDAHLLLYVGETIAADRRWKGEHDCKAYLSAYSEALGSAGLKSELSIRFWTDVPESTRSRRNLEQELIQRWLPPFNKETRSRWATPFTAEIH